MKKYLFCVLLFFVCNNSFCQLLTNNNVSLTITNGAQLTVKGNILNNGTSTINNSGTIDCSGDWLNNSTNNCFGISQGTVILNGNNQNIGGSNTTAFNNLTVVGIGNKKLLQNVSVGGNYATPSGILSIGAGFIDLNSQMLTQNNSSNISISRSTGYIISETSALLGYGILQWNISNATTGTNFIFPFGNNLSGNYLPVNFNVTTAGIGTNGFISIATYPTATNSTPNNLPYPTGLTSLINNGGVDNSPNTLDRYWIFNSGNYTTVPTSDLTFTYRDSEWDLSGGSTNTLNESQLQTQSNNGSTWTTPPSGIANTISNSVTVNNVNVYNPIWTLSSSSSPLPIELLSFDAKAVDNKKVVCEWITASELNNDYFEVLRSKNGKQFEKIGQVKGAGTSQQLHNYSFVDLSPSTGISYYQLRQVDYDGKSSTGNIKAVSINSNNLDLFVYPNPATTHLNIIFPEELENVTLRLFNSDGAVIISKNIFSNSIDTPILILDVANLSNGNYLLELQSIKKVFQRKISILK